MGSVPSRRRGAQETQATKASPAGGQSSVSYFAELSLLTAAPPGSALEAARDSRAAAQQALERRRRPAGAEACWQSLQRALQVLTEGRPAGLKSPAAALEAFLHNEGIDVNSATAVQMRKALSMAEAAQTVGEPPELRGLVALDSAVWQLFDGWCRRILLLEAFRLCNTQKSHGLTAEELLTLLMLISMHSGGSSSVDPTEAEQVVREFDIDGDGELSETDFSRMLHELECEVGRPADSIPEVPAHLVLYFDVNNTCLIGDSITGMGHEAAMSMMLARSSWGIRSQRPDGMSVWVLVCPEPHQTPPWAGLTSYAEFVSENLPLPKSGDAKAMSAVKKERRALQESFCAAGQPGERMRHILNSLLALLRQPSELLTQGDEKRRQATAGVQLALLPSFYFLLQELKRAGRSFTVVFRTFGVDMDDKVAAEFNAFCEGRHPLFPGGLVLDGTDGGADHRMDLDDASSMGTFFRSPKDGAISLVWGTHEQPSASEDIQFFDCIPDTSVHVGVQAAAESLERRVLERSRTVVLRDYYPGWERASYKGVGGKPLFISAADQSVMPIFFDDNACPIDPNIVDAMDAKRYPQRIPMAQVFGVHLVQALPVWSVRELTYFAEHVQTCETRRSKQLSRRRKVAQVLNDPSAVHAVIELLGGGEDLVLQVTAGRATSKKFTAWKELEFVRHATPFDEFGEDQTRAQARRPSMRWPDGPTGFQRQRSVAEQQGGGLKRIPSHAEPTAPIKLAPELERQRFLSEEWEPYTRQLQFHLEATRKRRATGYSMPEIMPPQATVVDLVQRCLKLTAKWHGRPNASAVYEFLMEAAACDGHSPYVFEDLAQQRSEDGYVRVLDGQVRRKLYTAGRKATKVATGMGDMKQSAGESPIDNLVLPSLVRRSHAVRLRASYRIQQWFLRSLQRKQRRLLNGIGLTPEAAISDPVRIREQLEEDWTLPEMMEELDSGASLARTTLVQHGHLLESYGQLPMRTRNHLEDWLNRELCREARPEDELDEELENFMRHCERHPGRSWQGSRVQHKLMLLKAIADPGLRLLWRSEVEVFTQLRYFVVPWTRAAPLLALPDPIRPPPLLAPPDLGGTGANPPPLQLGPVDANVPLELRPPGAPELSRFRRNVFAYGESHGLGQSGGGCAEMPAWAPGSLMYEFGCLLCEEESAKVPNHRVTDIERIVRDTVLLCPEGGEANALPGEVLHDVAHNPVIASSIGPTHHVQVTCGSASDWPLMVEKIQPKWCSVLQAWIDVVQVGRSEDAFFVQVRTMKPEHAPLLRLLVGLRAELLGTFGHTVDFTVFCVPTREGEFLVCLAPVAALRKTPVPRGEGVLGLDWDYENPEIKERVTQHRLPVATVDASDGKGNILADNEEFWAMAMEGRPMLSRLYDFNRRPGSRAATEAFLRGIEDPAPTWLRTCLLLRPFGVLGTQILASGVVRRAASEAVSGVGVLDAVAAPAGSAPSASFHRYGHVDSVHVTVPGLASRSPSRPEVVDVLSRCYSAALSVLAKEPELRGLRLLPLGGELCAGAELAAQLAEITREALQRAFALLQAEEQLAILSVESVELCVFTEAEFPAFETAFKRAL